MDDILFSVEGGLAEIVFHRPERKNAIARSTVDALERALEGMKTTSVRGLLLSGAGHTFVAGGDLADLHAMSADDALAVMNRMRAVLAALVGAPFPVVAWVEGDAVGGGVEIALAADLVLAHKDARFSLAQVPMGLTPGWGGLSFLERRVGPARSRVLLLTGAQLTAQEAMAAGLVDGVLADIEEARDRARRLAAMPQAAVAAVKALTGAGAGDGRELFADLWNSPQHRERVERFFKGGRHGDR